MVQWICGECVWRRDMCQETLPFSPVLRRGDFLHMKSSIALPCKRRIPCAVTTAFCLCWCAGLFLGTSLAGQAEPASVSLMRAAASRQVSILNLLFVLFIPFLLSAFAVFLSQRWLLFPIALGKAFSFGYTAGLIGCAYGTAWWLVRPLLMFSDCLAVPLLCWFMLRCLADHRRALWWDLALCAGITAMIGSIDIVVIAPFLAALIYS